MERLSYKTQKKIILFLFLAAPVALLLLMTYYPAVKLLQYSFTDWDGLNRTFRYVGFRNYVKIFQEPEIFMVFTHNLAYFLVSILQNVIAMFFAVLLNSKIRGRKAYRSMLFLPYIINSIAAAYLFAFMYDFEKGPINLLLMAVGIAPVRWLSNPILVNFSLAMIGLWRFTGYTMIIYLGALQSIDAELYECASLDGANGWRQFRHITLPSMTKIIELNLLLTITGALNAFNEAFSVTHGGPNGASTTFVMKTVQTAFEFSDYGLASAMGIVLMLIVTVIVGIQKKFFDARGS